MMNNIILRLTLARFADSAFSLLITFIFMIVIPTILIIPFCVFMEPLAYGTVFFGLIEIGPLKYLRSGAREEHVFVTVSIAVLIYVYISYMIIVHRMKTMGLPITLRLFAVGFIKFWVLESKIPENITAIFQNEFILLHNFNLPFAFGEDLVEMIPQGGLPARMRTPKVGSIYRHD